MTSSTADPDMHNRPGFSVRDGVPSATARSAKAISLFSGTPGSQHQRSPLDKDDKFRHDSPMRFLRYTVGAADRYKT